jgi:hypothetical protein
MKTLNVKKILSSTSAQVLNDFKENNIRRSKSMINKSNSFDNDLENDEECLIEFQNFRNFYPWIGLEIPEVIDKSLENVIFLFKIELN